MMSEETPPQEVKPEAAPKKKSNSAFSRITRYTSVRLVTLVFTVTVGIFLTILIANMGGYVDEIRRGEIRENVALQANMNPAIRNLAVADRTAWMATEISLQEDRLGLNKPFLLRTASFLANAMTLNLGRSQFMGSDSGSRQVRLIILERLPPTLVLFATTSLILFFTQLFIALSLSRRYGTFVDKAIIALAPTSAAPAWFYGIFLILIFAAILKVLPFGGMVDAPPPKDHLEYALSLLKHMALPMLAMAANSMFLSIFTWRTFFLIYSSEDYVEMAKAKGLVSRDIERRYVLRPTLPTIITSFALTLIGLWTGAPILETVFNWPGLGRALYQAAGLNDVPVIVGEAVLYAYLLAITVFLLDFIYVLVDPRVKIGSDGAKA
jgi:peptide/nickel transport system permease protein